MPDTATEGTPDRAAATQELERIAASDNFRKAERCLRLLRYLIDRTIEGREGELKEYTLGVTVFERPDSFDPRTDPVVRLEARRLRLKLAEYYQQEGLEDPVVVELPKGAYVPRFRARAKPRPEPPEIAPARLPGLRWLAAGAAVVIFSLAAWYLLHKRAETPVMRPSIAVLGFRDLSGRSETSWINTAVSELINVELGGGQQLRTAPPENVARMRRELSITPESTYPTQLLERIGTNLGIDYAVAGSYQPSGDRVRIDIALFDIRSGRQIAAIATETSQDKLGTIAQECAARVRAALGIRLAPLHGPLAYPPAERAAMESYARGMERLRRSDALGARPLLETSASIAPSNPLVHSGLAAAWSLLGYDNRARDEAKQAFDSSAALGRVEQLEIEGRYRQMDHDWPRAIQVYQALFTLSPDDLEYGLLLASVQTYGGKAQEALATVGALRNLPRPLRDDPRIDLAEAQSAGALADFARTRRAAHAASEKAAKRGARLQYARARLLESGAMQNLRVTGFADVRAEARGICAELGDRACVAAAYRIEANALVANASPAAAWPLYQAVLEIANQIGDLNDKLNALAGMGYTEELRGNLKAAESDYNEAIAVASELGPQKKYPLWIDLAEVLAEEGRVGDARALGEQALDSARQSHDQESIATSQAVLAHTLALEGKFSDAIAQYDDAVRVLREVHDPFELSKALLELGDAQLAQGNAAEARRSFEEVRDIDHPSGGFARADLDLAFARLALAASQPGQAGPLARSALNTFAASGREGGRMEAAALLARVLIAGGNAKDASAVLAAIPSPEGKALPIEAVVQFRIARCLVEANAGRRAEAAQGMERIAAEVARLGLPPLAHETSLARAAVMKTADTAHHDLRQ